MKIKSLVPWILSTSLVISTSISQPSFSAQTIIKADAKAAPELSSILRSNNTNTTSSHPSAKYSSDESSLLYDLPPSEEIPPPHETSTAIAQADETAATPGPINRNANLDTSKTVLINFNNVSIIEYIRFVSRLANKNFVFDDNDLQFNVTIISEEPATIDNIMTALLQELRIHDLILIEEGNNLLIHKNNKVNSISKVVPEAFQDVRIVDSDIITQVFRLNTLDPERAALILRPLVSGTAQVEVLKDSNHLIVTDLSANIEKISQLLKSVDAPNSGLVIGQYVSRLTPIDTLIPLAQQIMQPISQDQTLAFISHAATNSIFIVSSPFLVERTIAILQYLDQEQGSTRILNLNDLRLAHPLLQPGGQGFYGVYGAPGAAGAAGTAGAAGAAGAAGTAGAGGNAGASGIPGAGGGAGAAGTPGGIGFPGAAGSAGAAGAAGTQAFPGIPSSVNAPGTAGQAAGYLISPTGGVGGFGAAGGVSGVNGATTSPGFQSPENLLRTPSGTWIPNLQGTWTFRPEIPAAQVPNTPSALPPQGNWTRDYEGNWSFNFGEATVPGGPAPKGKWLLDKDGNWVYQLEEGEPFNPAALNRQFQGRAILPGGIEKKTKFFIFKLEYRRGERIEPVLRQIADTIQQNERGNEDLISALRSVQWLQANNSLVFSGTPDALDKVNELVKEVDIPVRQVFIEMLILETTLLDSLSYGVSYGTNFGGGNTTGAQGFFSGQSPLIGALTSTGIAGFNAATGIPVGTNLAQGSGFNLGVIGQKITHCGTEFGSIGALVNALHDRSKDKVVSTPKILVEDNASADLFVGINTPYRTQSIANDFGSVITSNYEYRDVGTHLKVTPYLGNGDIIALDIYEEVSTILAGLITNASTASTSPGPTTRINRTTTRVHIPNNYFLIISGMIQNEESRDRNQVPCLGAVPILGAGFSSKTNADTKRCLMIFIRPEIIDTDEQVQCVTKHQQDIYDYQNILKDSQEYEVTEALDLFNIEQTLHPEDTKLDEDKFN